MVFKTANRPLRDDEVARYMAETRKYPMLDAETEVSLARSWRDDRSAKAADRLIGSHLRLVIKIARGYSGYGLPLAELVAEGNLGLVQALAGFDPEQGFRFSTYAAWWIRSRLQEYVMRSKSLVRIGTTAAQKKLFFNLRRMLAERDEIHGGELSQEAVAAIAKELRVREAEVVEMSHRLAARDASLNERVGAEQDAEWQDLLADEAPDQESRLTETDELEMRRKLLGRALEQLSERERNILIERRLKESAPTLEDLGQQYGITRERVRQIEARALEKLGRSLRALAVAA